MSNPAAVVGAACVAWLAGCEPPAPHPEPSLTAWTDGEITISGDLPEQPVRVDAEFVAVVDETVIVYDATDDEYLRFRDGAPIEPVALAADSPVEERIARHRVDRNRMLEFTRGSTFIRASEKQGEVWIPGDGPSLRVRSVSGGYLADAWRLPTPAQGIWIQQEELISEDGTHKGEAVNALLPMGTIARYGADGIFAAAATVPIRKPRGRVDYFTVDEQGQAYYLKYHRARNRVEPEGLVLSAMPEGMPLTEAAVSFDVAAERETELLSFEALVRGSDAEAPPRLPPTTRTAVRQRAEAILSSRWTLSDASFAADRPSRCGSEDLWARPARLTANQVGFEIDALPYKWGGNRSIDHFLTKIGQGALAGDVCTCRCRKPSGCTAEDWCIVEDAVGLDCSGFVSQAWDISYHSTTTLHQTATPIRWQDLQTGDILNVPGNHVRLFIEFAGGDELGFVIIESSVGCGGVCRQTLRASELAGYLPYRYDQLVP